ncbi:ABC transporter ATP-binding protein [Rothia nasimurium]|uniref:ABC transporter ATP-binding protein n=1 Tax=Rothia nasimurium TaxID=85336 RepID=UPI001F169AE4|nr:ABC transporter ATP-binding protein [Rothia nasimurium]
MKTLITRLKYLFPGKNFYLLILNVVLLFLVSLFDLLGVAAILPVIQVATGEDYTSGYLGQLHKLLGSPNRETFIISMSIILVLSFITKGIFSLAIKWWSSGFIARQQTASSVAMLGGYLKEPYIEHRKRTTPEILQITGSANGQVYSGYVGGFLSIIGEGLSIILLMGLLAVVMPLETLIAFLYFGIAAFIIQNFLKKRNRNAGHIVWTKELESSAATITALDGFRENIIHGIAERSLYNYQAARLGAVEANRRKGFYFDLPKYLLEIVFIGGIALIMGAMIAMGGIQQVAYMAIFAAACIRILPNFVRVISALGTIRTALPYVERYEKSMREINAGVFKFLESEPIIGNFSEVNETIKRFDVSIENLSYKYPDGEENVLKNLNFQVPSGTSVAFVGGSGSGKTTLIDLILGLLEPNLGKVAVNGTDIRNNLDFWHANVGYVPQDVFISGKTVREEIAYGLKPEEIDDDRVWKCVQLAELEDVVSSLARGLDTEIGENGARLSGGQRQRIGLARAFYRNPSVLILDEATSALDNETEYKITKAINRLTEGRTVFIVAHRLSTVRDVDQLLFMSKGEVVARGSFSEVRAQNAEFARLVDLGQLPD